MPTPTSIGPLREKDYLDIRNTLKRLDSLNEQERVVCKRLDNYLNYPLDGRAVARSGILSVLVSQLGKISLTGPLKLLLRVLTEIVSEMTVYPADLQQSHYEELKRITNHVPCCVLHGVRLTSELINFEDGRRGVVKAGIHTLLADMVIDPASDKDVMNAALGVLTRTMYRARVSDDHLCYNAMLELDMCSRFVKVVRQWVSKAIWEQECKQFGSSVRPSQLLKHYSFRNLPQSLDICYNWAALLTLLIDEDDVFSRVQHQQRPEFFEALELIMPYAMEAFGKVLIKRLIIWAETPESSGICSWMIRAGLFDSIHRCFRDSGIDQQGSLEQLFLQLLVAILRSVPDIPDLAQYEIDIIQAVNISGLEAIYTRHEFPPPSMEKVYREFAKQMDRLRRLGPTMHIIN